MPNLFFVSDTHFSHKNILTFKRPDGTPVRPGFKDADEMDEVLIANWNSVVRKNDTVYHLGDMGFNEVKLDQILSRLNGRKVLILGNHDNINGQHVALRKHFRKIMLEKVFRDESFLATHMPLYPTCMFKVKYNIHSHIHDKPDVSNKHLNVSVEATDYKPISIEEVVARLKAKDTIGRDA